MKVGDLLLPELGAMPVEAATPVARAFAQFLGLANIAEQHHGLSREMDAINSASRNLNAAMDWLRDEGADAGTEENARGGSPHPPHGGSRAPLRWCVFCQKYQRARILASDG